MEIKVKTILEDEEYLRQISKEVDLSKENLKEEINILDEFCKNNDVMAMAAIQLGIPKRMIYLKNTNLDIINKMQKNKETEEEKNYNEAKILINPQILKREGLTTYWEACASCGELTGFVKRPYKIEIEYLKLDGTKKREILEGFPATVFSHEYDHLNGVLHMDIAEKILKLKKEERKKLRQHEGYQIISKEGNYEELLKN